MIARESLAMGNWVTDENGMPFFIDGLFTDEVYLNFEGNEADVWEVPYTDLQPIPLTDKILKRMGFERGRLPENDSFGVIGTWYKSLNETYFIEVVVYRNNYHELIIKEGLLTPIRGQVKYLHTLQNFVFLATGIQLAGEDFNDNEVFKD